MMKSIPLSSIQIHDGFWKVKQTMVKNVTTRAVYDRFTESHRFDALRCKWKEEGKYDAHIFWDSDVAKWIEGVAYILQQEENPELEALAESAISEIIKNTDENGYFNSYYLCACPDKRFTNRDHHELYCAGHLMEAAIAWRDATGKDDFLKAMCRYADYIEKMFKIEHSTGFFTPGHPELELALVKLYHATSERRYLELSKYFIDERSTNESERIDSALTNGYYNQDMVPLRELQQPDGHCVKALYLLCGMIDVAMEYQDEALANACRRCFDSILNKRMYITGSVGSTYIGEAFTIDYHLPNRTAYTETCAAIALALFAGRMQKLEVNSAYADTVERAMYNGILSGVSMDGKAFFYENPLEIDPKFNHVNFCTKEQARYPITERVEVFDCSCCPPNILRFISSIANFLYTTDDDTLYVHHYMDSEANCGGISVIQKNRYPADGLLSIVCQAPQKQIALRIPGWCRSFRLNHPYELKNGYAYVTLDGKTELLLELDMPVTVIAANRQVHECAGRVAVTRGPVVYCMEGVDNGDDLKSVSIDPAGAFQLAESEFLLPNIVTTGWIPKSSDALYSTASDCFDAIPLKLIPYYAFANRGTTEMHVWILRK